MVNSVSLYIHVPFCTKKCPYCHFFVLPYRAIDVELFLASLKKEWIARAPLFEGKHLISIYFGGGTPSLLSPLEIEEILSWFDLSSCLEITIEINPETVSTEKILGYKTAGVNRASIGLQSLDDDLLKILGRNHDSYFAQKSIELVANCGIDNISVDLMYDLPYQTVDSWQNTLEQLKKLPLSHLSLYNLTFEPGTVFQKKKSLLSPHLPSSEQSLLMLEHAVSYLPSIGLHRYEISAFAKPGKASLHNLGYWTARPFLGLGPSAFSYIEFRRFRNVCNLRKYKEMLDQNLLPEDFEETLCLDKRQGELLAIALRILDGVDLISFTKKYGSINQDLQASIKSLIDQGLLKKTNEILSITTQGLLFYDSIGTELV